MQGDTAGRLPFYLFIDINSMPHYTVTLHASHKLSFSFTIIFTFNNNKTIVEVHYNVDNNNFTSAAMCRVTLQAVCHVQGDTAGRLPCVG